MRLSFAILLPLLVGLTACNRHADTSGTTAPAEALMQADMAAAAPMEEGRFASAPVPPPPPKPEPPAGGATAAIEVTQRVIIRNASLTLVVKDAESELRPLADIAGRFGGFVSQSGFSRGEGDTTSGTVELRVDARRLDEALEAIRARAIEVRDLSISSQDVTGEVVDVEARLRNLRSAETQLLAIMQQAKKTADVMSVFGQLTQTRGEIEQLLGRLNYLRESSALSTVSLTLQADEASRPVEVAGWQPTGTAKRAIENLLGALQSLADFAIWAVIVLGPLFVVVVLPLAWLWRRWRRARRAAIS